MPEAKPRINTPSAIATLTEGSILSGLILTVAGMWH